MAGGGNQIGPLTAKIIANSEGMDPGLQQAEAKVKAATDKMATESGKAGEESGKKWAAGLADGIRTLTGKGLAIGQSLASLAEKAMTNPGRMFADAAGALGSLAGKIPAVGSLLALPFEGVASVANTAMDLYDKGAERLKMLGQESMRANMPLKDFQVLTETLGGDLSSAAAQIFKFQAALEDAASAGKGAHNVFTQLGLDTLELQTKGTKAAFSDFADKVRGLGTSFAQVAAAKEIWGRGAADVLPSLLRGSEFMQKRQNLLDTFGAGFSGSDFENLKKAQLAKKEFSLLWQGLETQVTIGLAPVFRSFAELMPKLSEMGISAKGLAGVVSEIGFKILEIGAGIVDFIKAAWEDPWGTLKATFADAALWLIDTAADVGRKIGDAIADGVKRSFTPESLRPFFHGLRPGDPGYEALGPLVKSTTGPVSTIAPGSAEWQRLTGRGTNPAYDLALGSAKAFADAFADLAGENATSGMAPVTSGRKSLADMVRDLKQQLVGPMAEIKAEAQANNPFAVWESAASGFAVKLEAPMDKVKSQWKSLKGLLFEGAGNFADLAGPNELALWNKLAGRGGFQLLQGLRSAAGSSGPLGSQFVGAAEAGSREAFSAITQYTSARETLEQEIARLLKEGQEIEKQQLDEGKRTVEILKDLAANLRVGGDF